MDPHATTRPTRLDVPPATAPPAPTFGPQGPTLGDLIDVYLQDYELRQFRSISARSPARFSRIVSIACATERMRYNTPVSLAS